MKFDRTGRRIPHRTNPAKKRRRALLKAMPPDDRHTEAEWQALQELYEFRCVECLLEKSLTRDHIIPISKGGSEAIENIQPMCFDCNNAKGNQVRNHRDQWGREYKRPEIRRHKVTNPLGFKIADIVGIKIV